LRAVNGNFHLLFSPLLLDFSAAKCCVRVVSRLGEIPKKPHRGLRHLNPNAELYADIVISLISSDQSVQTHALVLKVKLPEVFVCRTLGGRL